jgi:hypothetical protein
MLACNKYENKVVREVRHLRSVAIFAAVMVWALPAWGKDFCCPCENGKMISVDERNNITASVKCSVLCKDATRAVSGQCKIAAGEDAKAQSPHAGGEVALFTTEDCSGNAVAITASSSDLSSHAADGLRSFQVVSGSPASAWSGTGFSGARTQPVAASLCISPGWPIKSLKIGTD